MHATLHAIPHPIPDQHLFRGYRFRVCEDEHSAARAVAVREQSGHGSVDAYDGRSWLLLAERTTGEAVGTLRVTPRMLGPLAVEEHVTLPRDVALPKCFELSRLAILPMSRRARRAVTLGLCKLAYEFSLLMGSECQVAYGEDGDAPSWVAIGFRAASTAVQDGSTRKLLLHDFRRAGTGLLGNPFHALFCHGECPEVVLPVRTAQLGLGAPVEDAGEPDYRRAVGA